MNCLLAWNTLERDLGKLRVTGLIRDAFIRHVLESAERVLGDAAAPSPRTHD
jgi:hypothetical protein